MRSTPTVVSQFEAAAASSSSDANNNNSPQRMAGDILLGHVGPSATGRLYRRLSRRGHRIIRQHSERVFEGYRRYT